MENIEPYGDKEITVYEKAIIKWGIDDQVFMLLEEMSELTKALLHKRRGREDNVAEEFADVEILMNQLRPIFNQEGLVDKWKELKLERLEKRVG